MRRPFTDPAGFALRLGIECALQLDKRSDVKLSALERFVYEQSSCRTDLWEGSHPIDTFFNVYHGPVHYTDYSGRVTTQEEWSDPFAGPMAWFTKEPDLQDQSEYRFAVSTLGTAGRGMPARRHFAGIARTYRSIAILSERG